MSSPFVACQTPLSPLLNDLCTLLQQASALLERLYHHYLSGQHLQVDYKQDTSPVTQADWQAHQLIVKALGQLTPDIPVLSEEGLHDLRQQWSHYWLLDPLDGTREFIEKTGEFTINLSLMRHGQVDVAALAVPLQHCLYFCQAGNLPFRYEWSDGEIRLSHYHPDRNRDIAPRPLQLAMSRRADKSPWYGYLLADLQQRQQPVALVQAGSAYKFALMLEGDIDAYVRFHPTSEWDTAAGQGLLEAIGGALVDMQGRPFRYNQRTTLQNDAFIAVRKASDWQQFAPVMQLVAADPAGLTLQDGGQQAAK